jgi:hypothetical protein
MFHSFKRVAILLGILLGAAVALAQSTPVTNSYDLSVTDETTVNSCSVGEPVALNGTVHLDYSVTTDTSGANHFAIAAANNLSGVGQKTGAAYAANDSEDYTSNTTDGSADLTVELKSDLKSQAGAPALTLVQSLHIVVDTIGNISAQVVSNTTSCGS